MSRSPRLLLIFAPALLLIVVVIVFAVWDGDDEARPQVETTPTVTSQTSEALAVGDWVEISNAEGCVVAVDFPPRQEGFGNSLACLSDGAVLRLVDGPLSTATADYWAISGFGWIEEEFLTFRHRGDPPFPENEGLRDLGLIAYVGPDGALWLMNSDGTDKRKLVDDVGPFARPAWSPDGTKIAFVAGQPGPSQAMLAVVDLVGNPLFVRLDALAQSELVWAPDSSLLAANTATPDGLLDDLVVLTTEGHVLASVDVAASPVWASDSQSLGVIDITGYDEAGFPIERGMLLEGVDFQGTVLDSIDGFFEGPPAPRPGHPDQVAFKSRVFEPSTGSSLPLPAPAAEWSPDGRHIISAERSGNDFFGVLYNVGDGRTLQRFDLAECECDGAVWAAVAHDASFSNDGRFIAWAHQGTYQGNAGYAAVLDLAEAAERRLPINGLPGEAGVAGFSPDGRFLLQSGGSFVEHPGVIRQELFWISATDVESGELTVLAEGRNPAWQPKIPQSPELQAVEAELLRGALQFSAMEIEPGFLGECTGNSDLDFIACTRYLGSSGNQKGYEVLAVPGDCPFGIYFVRPEGPGWVIDHVEPPFCNCAIPCDLGTGAIVEILVEETCANVRSAPSITAEINECLPAGTRAEIVGEPVNTDARVWVELDSGWVSASFVDCVENCG